MAKECKDCGVEPILVDPEDTFDEICWYACPLCGRAGEQHLDRSEAETLWDEVN